MKNNRLLYMIGREIILESILSFLSKEITLQGTQHVEIFMWGDDHYLGVPEGHKSPSKKQSNVWRHASTDMRGNMPCCWL